MATSRSLLGVMLLVASAGCAASSGVPRDDERLLLRTAARSDVDVAELWRDHDATVLVFWSAGCPCVRRYQQRIDALLDRYPPQRVRVVGISSNAGEPFAEVLRAGKERGVRIPLLRDETGRVAELVGARSTPTAVVVDRRGKVRFRGWIDNERQPGEAGRQPWLEQAVDALLLDRKDFRERTPLYGCPITRSLFKSSSGHSCCKEQGGQP